jgi:hypothetical protein
MSLLLRRSSDTQSPRLYPTEKWQSQYKIILTPWRLNLIYFGFEFHEVKTFTLTLRSPTLPPTLLFNVYGVSFREVKRPGREVNHSPPPPSSANVKNKCGYTSVDMENFTSFLPFTETSCSYLTENTVCSIIKTSRWCRTGIQWLLVGRIMWNSLINRGQNPNVLVWRYVWSLGCES